MINCYEYCKNRANFGEDLQDPMVAMAADIENMEEQITELRTQRWQLASLGLNRAGNVSVEVLDKAAFKQSIEAEEKLLADIARIKGLFAQLNPVFAQAQNELVRYSKPTLQQLMEYRQSCLNRAFLLEGELKTELHYRLTSSRNTAMTMDQIVQEPDFVAYKNRIETTIKGLQDEARIAAGYVAEIEEIMKNN